MVTKEKMVHKKHYKLKIKKKDLALRALFYKVIQSLPKKSRCAIIPYLSDTAINYLCEAIYNTVKTDIGLTKAQKKKLRGELSCCKSKIGNLCSGKVSVKSRRKILSQKGGFLGALLATVLPIVTSLITGN